MTEYQSYRNILREELKISWNMLVEQGQRPVVDVGRMSGGMGGRQDLTTLVPGSSLRSVQDPGKGLGVRVIDRGGYQVNLETGERKPSLGIIADPPDWLIAWFEAMGIDWQQPGLYFRRVDTVDGHTIWKLYDENGVVQGQYILYNGQVYPIEGNWTYAGTDETGQPLFEVNSADPPYERPLDGSWREYTAGAFPGINWAIRRYSDGRWRADHNGDGNWDDPGWIPPGGNPINPGDAEWPGGNDAEVHETWWDSLSGGTQLLLIMAVAAGLIAAGTGLGLWLSQGGHQNTRSGGPPVIPDDGGNPGEGNGGGSEPPGDPPG